jgi:NDP-sugar pyrophosphorylase family protein
MILAGGLGTRLREVVTDRPKPMAAIQGRPFLDLLITELLRQGLRRIILCISHGREQILAHYQDRSDAEYLFSEEETPLGTGGAVRHAAGLVSSDPFLVLNGDSWCAVDYAHFAEFHSAKQAEFSMVVAAARGRADGGTVELADDARITRFREKAGLSDATRTYINAGVYLLRKGSPMTWRQPTPFSLEHDILPGLAQAGRCFGYAVEGEVVDIGTPERYAAAQAKLAPPS